MSVPKPSLREKIQFLVDFMIPSFNDKVCSDQTEAGRELWIKTVRATQMTLPAEPLLTELLSEFSGATEYQLHERVNLLMRDRQLG